MSEDAVGDYIPVDINLIRPESIAGFSIYVSSRNGYALFRDSNTQFDQGALSQLTDAGVATVYVKKDDQESLDQYYLDTLQGLLNDPASSLSQKTKAICSSSAAMARELLMRPTGVELGRARSLMESTVIELVNVPETLYELILATGHELLAAHTYGELDCIHAGSMRTAGDIRSGGNAGICPFGISARHRKVSTSRKPSTQGGQAGLVGMDHDAAASSPRIQHVGGIFRLAGGSC